MFGCTFTYYMPSTVQIQAALDKAGLHVGAINIRFPHDFVRGAFTNPDSSLRAAAVQLAEEAFKKAYAFVAKHVVVWSPYDGYDLNLQVRNSSLHISAN